MLLALSLAKGENYGNKIINFKINYIILLLYSYNTQLITCYNNVQIHHLNKNLVILLASATINIHVSSCEHQSKILFMMHSFKYMTEKANEIFMFKACASQFL